LNIPVGDVEEYDEIRSIDEAQYKMKNISLWNQEKKSTLLKNGTHNVKDVKVEISREEEFKAHCSNMHAWVDNNYATEILHRTMSFPLLKALVEAGDQKAKSRYKDELAYRLSSNELVITHYLIKQHYLEDLEEEEIEIILDDLQSGIAKTMLVNRNERGKYTFDDKMMALKNDDFIISDLKQNPIGYENYKKAFPLKNLEKYSEDIYNGVYINFGLKWHDQRVVFKTVNLEEAITIFGSDKKDIMVQIPRERAPLKLYVEKENLAIYFYPILIF
jgi:hypothetical protein